MKRSTITIPEDLERALDTYRADQEVPPDLTAVTQAALREYLSGRGYLASRRRPRISPWERGSGLTDASTDHDRYLAAE